MEQLQFLGKKSQKGWLFTQLESIGAIQLWQKVSGASVYYEVFISQIGRYPNDDDFGISAWCYYSHSDAVEKMNTLISQHSQDNPFVQ